MNRVGDLHLAHHPSLHSRRLLPNRRLHRILLAPKAPGPLLALVPLNLDSFFGARHRAPEDGVIGLEELLGGDVFKGWVEVEVVHHPVVQVWKQR